jgi:hypothetical protein
MIPIRDATVPPVPPVAHVGPNPTEHAAPILASVAPDTSTPARQRVFLHIGAPKTGTTFLQDVLVRNKAALRANGLLYPGRNGTHVMAALDLRNLEFKGHRYAEATRAWPRMVNDIKSWGRDAIIDQELFAGATEKQVARALRALDFADVHIVLTVRDMARQLPAAWQEWIRNRETESFAEWLHAIHPPDDAKSDARWLFWRLHDIPEILRRWTGNVQPDHVHVVIVPPAGSDPGILWQRFAGVLDVDPDAYDTRSEKQRASLSAAEVEALRALNIALRDEDVSWLAYDRIVKRYLAFQLGARRGDPIALPKEDYDWAVDWSRKAAGFIAAGGYHVVGDLDDLIPTAPRPGVDPDGVSAEARADAAVAGMVALIKRVETVAQPKTARASDAERELRTRRELSPRERTKQFLVELSEQVGWLGRLRRGYHRLRR